MRTSTQRRRADIRGQVLTWLSGGALALNLLLAIGLLGLIASEGLGHFRQRMIVQLKLTDGSSALGEIAGREQVPPPQGEKAAGEERIRLKLGNRDLYDSDFRWIDEADILVRSHPQDAVLLERLEWGNFYGFMLELRRGDERLAIGPQQTWERFQKLHEEKTAARGRIRELEQGDIGNLNREIERLRLQERTLDLGTMPAPELARRRAEIEDRRERKQAEYETRAGELFALRKELVAETVLMEAVGGERKELAVGEIVRAVRPNQMGTGALVGLYVSRVWEFVTTDPRESNTEGGIFPAIFGTVMMVFLMSAFVAPFGVLAALYLSEYAKQGALVRIVRIAVNNLAGVPSIVFGVFGLGFFVYWIGGSIDQLFYPEALPAPTFGTGGILWASLTLALLTVPVVIVATEEGLAAVPRVVREGSLALGATKFETIWRIVVPAAGPGILTGMILAMARAAGEVAPLMIVGMVKLAPALPIDHHFPYVHLERKFMHLGFHIYDVGFQSPNVEAAQPLVFATALLLVATVAAINLAAIVIRDRLRTRYAGSAV